MKWNILILTQPSRERYLARLSGILFPQLNALNPDVRVPQVAATVKLFEPEFTLGENRQRMVEASSAEYVSFVDDDDLVSPDYVARIFPLLDGVDMVGFNVACFIDGKPIGIARHSLRYGEWVEDANGYYRDLSYMTPMRRALVLRSRIEGGYGEDRRWAARLRALRCVWTEHYVDEVLYEYLYRTNKEELCEAR